MVEQKAASMVVLMADSTADQRVAKRAVKKVEM